MSFKIEFSQRSQHDLEEIFEYIYASSPENARRWRTKLEEKLMSLTTQPEACGLALENEYSSGEVRQMIFGRYRVLFTIRDQTVYLLTIRHSARKEMKEEELNEIE
ncbi:MAG: type II toxin-antitoxin system RelE/ParE family toxin [Planctomycetaceae bacterium]|nr:type II toxin-antitoxin system RelE/ParE family toxin [Planctomycetaceae bacterium]